MRPIQRSIILFLSFAVSGFEVYAESRTEPFVARIHRSFIGQFTGLHTSCVVVHGDGRYRLEDLQQDLGGGPVSTRIYMDSMPDSMVQRLHTIIDSKSFREINAPVNNDRIINSVDSIAVTIRRKNETQDFTFLDLDSRKPYEKALKPLLDWFREVQKRKLHPQKGAVSNKCAD